MKHKNPAAVALGRLGGKAGTGDSKRRKVSRDQASHAANVRWVKWRAKNGKPAARSAVSVCAKSAS